MPRNQKSPKPSAINLADLVWLNKIETVDRPHPYKELREHASRKKSRNVCPSTISGAGSNMIAPTLPKRKYSKQEPFETFANHSLANPFKAYQLAPRVISLQPQEPREYASRNVWPSTLSGAVSNMVAPTRPKRKYSRRQPLEPFATHSRTNPFKAYQLVPRVISLQRCEEKRSTQKQSSVKEEEEVEEEDDAIVILHENPDFCSKASVHQKIGETKSSSSIAKNKTQPSSKDSIGSSQVGVFWDPENSEAYLNR